MKVKDLKKLLEKYSDNTEVIIDGDENGWYSLESIEPYTDEDRKNQFVNLVSSNEI